MKKQYIRLLCYIVCYVLCITVAEAIPAWPGTQNVTQPDGTMVTLRLCGDEFYHFWTTDDGYTVIKDATGRWCYAKRHEDTLVASAMVAHDAHQRSDAEREALSITTKRLTAKAGAEQSKRNHVAMQAQRAGAYDYGRFRGLIVLVEPSDVSFSHESGEAARAFYDTMVNTPGFTGFSDHPELGEFTGSVRDYYYDNSCGMFDPHFDVLGPVKVDYPADLFSIDIIAQMAFLQAVEKIDSTVNFSRYDTNNDRIIDMAFFLVAGYGSHSGNNEGYLWPHMGHIMNNYYYLFDSRIFDIYACSTEMGGLEGQGYIDGIGTFCHEFGHVLGLPDLYDVDYASSGQSHDPGYWDIMAKGGYLNNSRTPSGYSLYERCALGFAKADTLKTDSLQYALPSLGESNKGYLLPGVKEKEYFLLENRQPTYKWDSYLPGHGMIIARVDSTNVNVWTQNNVNCDPEHNYYELVRAGGSRSGSDASDPFPGSKHITQCSNFMLASWDDTAHSRMLDDIVETDDGSIMFTLNNLGEEKQLVETFDSLEVDVAPPYEGQGDIATWKLLKCQAIADGEGHAVAMVNPSSLTMTTPVHANIGRMSFQAHNTSNSPARLRLYYSTDGGENWITGTTPQGDTYYEIGAQASMTINWNEKTFSDSEPVQLRIGMIQGSKKAEHPCLVDNLTIYYFGELAGNIMPCDVNSDGQVDIADVNAVINAMLGKGTSDQLLTACDVNGDGTVDIADVNTIINAMLGK